jgi:hypothetical protein
MSIFYYFPLPHPSGLLELSFDFRQVMAFQKTVIVLAGFAPVESAFPASALIESLNRQDALSLMKTAATPFGLI